MIQRQKQLFVGFLYPEVAYYLILKMNIISILLELAQCYTVQKVLLSLCIIPHNGIVDCWHSLSNHSLPSVKQNLRPQCFSQKYFHFNHICLYDIR